MKNLSKSEVELSSIVQSCKAQELTFTESEIAEMSAALVKQHGSQAINMAAFFLDEHLELEDHTRAESWLRVMTYLDLHHEQSLSDSLLN